MKQPIRRFLSILPFLITIPCLALIIYSFRFINQLPFDGMDWSRISGLVQSVSPEGPSYGLIEPGDVILEIDGQPVVQFSQPYQGKRAGDIVQFTIKRGTKTLSIDVPLQAPPLEQRIRRLTPHFLALSFLLIGILIRAYSPATMVSNQFFLLCMLASGALSSGSISAVGPEWLSKLFNVLIWWIGPATVHLHLHFPQDAPRNIRYALHPILYLMAILGSAPYILLKADTLLASPWIQSLFTLGRLTLAFNLVIAAGLLAFAYLRPTSADTRHKVRLVVLFGGIAFLLVSSLSLIPSALIYTPLVPYELSLLPLLLIPFSYGFAIVRYRLIALEKHLRRAAAYALILVLLATTLVAILAGIKDRLPLSSGPQIAVIITLTLIFSAAFEPLRKRLQKVVDFVFYGGWYDYPSALERLTDGLENYNDLPSLGNEITQRLKGTLKLEYALLALCPAESTMWIYPEEDFMPRIEGLREIRSLKIHAHGALCQKLSHVRPNAPLGVPDEELAEDSFTPAERQFVDFLGGKLPVTIMDKDTIVGLFLLGPKIGGETYSSEDLNLMAIVARQVGVSIQNIKLLDEVRQRATEIDALHQKILRAREEEQKRLARELHDEIIQALVGLNYQLSHLDASSTSKVKEEVRDIIQDVRRITTELRPPGLDDLGLVAAIRASVRKVTSSADLTQEIVLNIEGDESQEISEEIAMALYRVFAEAFHNALKHANATRVEVILNFQPEEIRLEVRDDGRGFEVPDRLGNLLERNSFGLVGIRERVDLVHGSFNIASDLGQGTHLTVKIPVHAGRKALALERSESR